MKKKGISLIVLVITIIVIIILAGAIILNLTKNNPINSARKAKFLNDIDTFKSELSLYELDNMAGTDGNYNPKLLNADKDSSTDGENITITDIITSMDKTRYPDILEVVAGELVYIGDNQDESNWSDGVIEVKDFKINIAVVPDTTHFSGTISLTGMMVDPNKIEYYKIYLSETSGEHGDTPAQEIREKNTPVDFNITEGVEPNKTYYIIVEVKMDNETDVRTKEIKVSSSIDNVAPNAPQISLSNYSKILVVTPVAITLTDNDGGSGINKTGSKYIIDQTSTNYTEDDNIWQTGGVNLTSESFVGDVATLGIEVASDGEYYVHVLSLDNAGNKKTSTSGKVIVDTIVPNEAGITIPTSTTTGSVDATVVLSDNEGGSGINLSESKYIYSTVSYPYGDTEAIWDTATVFTSETQTLTLTSSTNEVYYLHVLLVDKAGNRREVLSSGVTTNTDIPVAPAITGTVATDIWTNQNVTLTVNEVASPGIQKYEYLINGGSWQTYDATNKIVVTSEGTTTVKARAVNNLGTIGAESTGYIVKIDKTNPTISFSVNGGSTYDSPNTTVTVSDIGGSSINASSLYYVWYTLDTTPTGGWTQFNNYSSLAISPEYSTYYLWIKVTDNAGNAVMTRSNPFNVLTDYDASKGVNKPKLTTGMTPIKWDASGNIVTTIESDTDWYDYTAKKWANARTADGSMWVWIPRYEYKIPTPHSSTAQTINVNFVPNTQTSATNGYIVHPGFTFGTTELTGIWVAKFEPSGTINDISIKPNMVALSTIKIGDIFTACRNMETNIKYGWNSTEVDTHLMKNIEWGSVSYLTQSIYGKNSEVWINPSITYTTGQSGTTASSTETSNTYEYNNTTYGIQASTTGNFYGIYDMSGGSFEFTAAYIDNSSSTSINFGANLLNAELKYKDVYSVGNEDLAGDNYLENADKKGDAIYETSTSATGSTAWYNDFTAMPYLSSGFFIRGGYSYNRTIAGMFYFGSSTGGAGDKFSFRPVVLVGQNL